MKQAEYLIHRLEFGHHAFSTEEKDILTNYAFKLGDMEKTKEYADALASSGVNGVERAEETIRNMQAEIDALPDTMTGVSEMLEYGYAWDEMLPLTQGRALELFDHDLAVYQLYEDGSEAMIEDRKEISEHKGMFGIEKGDWEQYLQLRSLTTVKEESMEEREHQLLHGEGNQFGIYQLKKSPELREIRFENMDFLKSRGLSVNKDNYELIYTASLEEGVGLEDIFEIFNLYHPADYKGHSLSVSDIVVLHKEGENTSHFVDSFGYEEVPEFLQGMVPEKQAEKTSGMEKIPVEEADPVSYYVIEDISTWAENKPERSKLERFESFKEALEQFQAYREKCTQMDDKTRTTFGFNVHGSEFDALYARNNENILSLDFIHSSKALQSNRFIDDLQILCNELVDKVRVYRDMPPEEVKTFVKERFKFKLESSGLDDIDMYMSRFDTLYEQGKMEHLMPSVNQKRIVEDIPLEKWDNPYFALNEAEQMAFAVKDKYVSIHVCDEGYDYSIYHADYSLFDGGIYDNPDITIHAALYDILEDMGVKRRELIPVDYDELAEKAEAVEQAKIEEKHIISKFRKKTKEMFHDINGQTPEDVEQTTYAYIKSKIEEYEIDVEIVDVIISGSRCRGLEDEASDLDIVVEYKGREHEDDLFNAFNEDGFTIGKIKVDINPITERKTGTLATYLPEVESYLAEKQAAMEKEALAEQIKEEKKTIVTLTVAECGEFHNLGEYHEGIASVDEALAIFHQIPPERMSGIPSIGINVHTEGSVIDTGVQMDVISGKIADLETLEYVPEIINNQKAVGLIQELIAKMPEIEVRGSLVLGKEEAAKDLGRISIKEKLAEKKAIIDQKSKGDKLMPEKDTEKKKQREM